MRKLAISLCLSMLVLMLSACAAASSPAVPAAAGDAAKTQTAAPEKASSTPSLNASCSGICAVDRAALAAGPAVICDEDTCVESVAAALPGENGEAALTACPESCPVKNETIVTDKTCPAALGEACALANGLTSAQPPVFSCEEEEPAVAEYHKLSAQQAKENLSSGLPHILLDVRTKEEYEQKHIPGALLLPNEEIGAEPPAMLPDKNAAILLYCRSGRRSKEAAQKLVAMGYTEVYDFGGINDWPYETVQGAE